MKKNYIYLALLLIATVILTLFLAAVYKAKLEPTSLLYDKMRKINATEYEEYIMEHQDMIIYISDKKNLGNTKKEKSFLNKIEKSNLLEFVIYIDKEEFNKELKKKFKNNYSYEFDKNKLPAILVINDGELSEISYIDEEVDVSTIINYEVFE